MILTYLNWQKSVRWYASFNELTTDHRISYRSTLYNIILHSRVELSTVVMELGCPVPGLGGADSLTDPNNRTAVLHYLVHELMSLRLAATTVTQTKQVQGNISTF